MTDDELMSTLAQLTSDFAELYQAGQPFHDGETRCSAGPCSMGGPGRARCDIHIDGVAAPVPVWLTRTEDAIIVTCGTYEGRHLGDARQEALAAMRDAVVIATSSKLGAGSV